jgi:hypothetical protein
MDGVGNIFCQETSTKLSIKMPKPRARAQTWRFIINVQAGPMSNHNKVCCLFRGILNESKARIEINGLVQSSFSYDLPEDGLARISGYLRTNKYSDYTISVYNRQLHSLFV